jgi:hypothetical protein
MHIAAEENFSLVGEMTSARRQGDLQAAISRQGKQPQPQGFRRKRPGDFVVPQSKIHEGYSPSSRLVGGPFWAKQQYP